jgi:rhodanese-related sulfurtransferase
VKDYLGARDALEPLSREDLRRRLRERSVVLVDVRPADEFRAGHIPGAISMPIEEFRKRSASLPARKEVIAYCRGPYCVMAYDAVAQARAYGRRARRLVDGFPEWKAAGLPVEAGAGGVK